MSEDTYPGNLNNPISINSYVYAQYNPLTFVDPSGHRIARPYGGAGGGGGGGGGSSGKSIWGLGVYMWNYIERNIWYFATGMAILISTILFFRTGWVTPQMLVRVLSVSSAVNLALTFATGSFDAKLSSFGRFVAVLALAIFWGLSWFQRIIAMGSTLTQIFSMVSGVGSAIAGGRLMILIVSSLVYVAGFFTIGIAEYYSS
jgi:hypothetical protein